MLINISPPNSPYKCVFFGNNFLLPWLSLNNVGHEFIIGNKFILVIFVALSKTVVKRVLHYPTLKTVLMVEDILKDAKEPLSRYEIMKRSKNKIMRQTLNAVIDYLDKRSMVWDSPKGVLWVYTPPEKMKKWLKESVEV